MPMKDVAEAENPLEQMVHFSWFLRSLENISAIILMAERQDLPCVRSTVESVPLSLALVR
jgi:hypothetical protein